MTAANPLPEPWASVGGHLRRRGLRWAAQRRQVIEVLAESAGHVTGAEIVERCRQRDPAMVPSTVYRSLDVLEDLGLVRHGHGADGQLEYHVRPQDEHGHLHCGGCGRKWELDSHRTLVGRYPDCVPSTART